MISSDLPSFGFQWDFIYCGWWQMLNIQRNNLPISAAQKKRNPWKLSQAGTMKNRIKKG
jgi:hypothetical protein